MASASSSMAPRNNLLQIQPVLVVAGQAIGHTLKSAPQEGAPAKGIKDCNKKRPTEMLVPVQLKELVKNR
ncbi:hypothetical protein E2C01_048884 [Portunus trituberculatus]|uniref:Uncharacterized protein n=1 Tax=Portunus trituberculatus TaxID=210409 RepID=A0A5B7GEI5_PORTR|nr:hypothetical protein [Portunus trituberculatus]